MSFVFLDFAIGLIYFLIEILTDGLDGKPTFSGRTRAQV